MIRYLLTLFALTLLMVCGLIGAQSSFANPFAGLIAAGVRPPTSCPSTPNETSDQTADIGVGSNAASHFVGLSKWTDGGTPRTICRVDFELTLGLGDVSGKTYTAYIYTMTGTHNLDAVVATSAGVPGDNEWSNTWARFDLLTPFTTTGSVPYAIVITAGSDDGSNYVFVNGGDTDVITGHREIWSSAGGAGFGSGNDVSIRIYWQ